MRNAVSRFARSLRKSPKRAFQPEIEHDVDQRVAQAVLARVVRAVGRRIGVDVLGGYRGPHEQAPVVEIRAVQDLARDRIEEGLGALRLLVVDQQRNVVPLDRLPARIVDLCATEFALQASDGFGHASIVEVDAVLRRMSDRQPVTRLEVPFGHPGAIAEQRVVKVEAVERCLRDRLRGGGHRPCAASVTSWQPRARPPPQRTRCSP